MIEKIGINTGASPADPAWEIKWGHMDSPADWPIGWSNTFKTLLDKALRLYVEECQIETRREEWDRFRSFLKSKGWNEEQIREASFWRAE